MLHALTNFKWRVSFYLPMFLRLFAFRIVNDDVARLDSTLRLFSHLKGHYKCFRTTLVVFNVAFYLLAHSLKFQTVMDGGRKKR